MRDFDSLSFAYLLPFLQSCNPNFKSNSASIQSIRKIIGDESMWNTKGKSYENWLCFFTSKLCEIVDDEIFYLSKQISQFKREFCEFSFPFILFQIIKSTPIIQPLLSSLIQKFIFTNNNENLEIIQFFLSTVFTYFRIEIIKSQKTSDIENKHKH